MADYCDSSCYAPGGHHYRLYDQVQETKKKPKAKESKKVRKQTDPKVEW